MLCGDVVIGRFCRPALRQRLVLPLAMATGAPLLVFLLHPPLPVVVAVLFGCGFGSATSSASSRRSWTACHLGCAGRASASVPPG